MIELTESMKDNGWAKRDNGEFVHIIKINNKYYLNGQQVFVKDYDKEDNLDEFFFIKPLSDEEVKELYDKECAEHYEAVLSTAEIRSILEK